MTCRFCPEPEVERLFGKFPVCVRHAAFAKNTARELAGTAARAAGAALQHKAPLVFETGRALFAAMRTANAHNAPRGES